MRKLNLFFVAGLLAATSLLGIAVYFVHNYQVQRNAKGLLDRARRSESESKLSKAAESLRNYLSLRPDDTKAWIWYAQVMDQLYAESPRHREQVLLVHEEALRHSPDEVKLERKCVDLAMEFGITRLTDARRHIETLMAKLPKESRSPEGSELSELLGDCYSRESNFAKAEEAYQEAIRRDPARASCYFKLAQLDRNELRKAPAAADEQIATMVALNRRSGLAYLYRFRYDARFRPPASDRDLSRALELAPDDSDVLQTAAMECEAKNLSAAARVHLEKGARLSPTNLYFITGLANLESREQHPERAEAILRKAYERKPSWIFAFELARLLIEQNKIKGEGQAESFLAVLRRRGLGQSFGRMLEAQIRMKEGRYGDAIGEIEAAQAIFKSQDSRINAQLNLMLAECYRRTGETEKNIAALQNALQGGAASEADQLELARALIRSDGPGDLDSALRILQSLVGGHPELELDITRLLWQKTMRQPRDQRDWRPVEQELAKAASSLSSLEKRSESATALALLRAEVCTSQGDLEKAQSVLRGAVAADPRNPTLLVALARLAQRQEGKGKEALAILDHAEKALGPGMEIQLARLAYWEQHGGEEAKAEVAKLAASLEQVPASRRPVYLRRLAQTEAHLGLFQLARGHLAQLVSLQPEDRDAVFELFELALESGERTEVAGLIDRLYALENPGSQTSTKDRRAKGTYWRFAEALDLINQEIRRRQMAETPSPNSEAASTAKSAPLERACELAGEIEALRPGWWGGPLLSAKIADLSSSIPEAIAGYKRALELGNNRPVDLQRLVSLLAQLDRDDEIDQVITALRDPEGAPVELKIQTAISAMRRHDFARGLALANELFAKSNQYSDHLSLARFYAAAGDTASATEQYRRAVALGPGAPETWTSYVSCLVQAKQLDLAKAAIENARKALPADRSALSLAECYASIGEVKQAETEIQRALGEKSQSTAAVLRFAADFELAKGRMEDAEKYLNELVGPASGARPEDLAWANRIRAKILVRRGRPTDLDAARGLIAKNLDENPKSPEDNQVLASILAVQAKTRGQAIKILEPLDKEKRLGPSEQFLLAQLYYRERDEKKYQDEMLKIVVAGKSTSPLFLGHYIAYLIQSKQLDHARSWLAELKKSAPQSVATLELEVMLLKARNPAKTTLPEVRDLLVERGRTYPDLIGPVAALLGSCGFPAEAEAAYKEFMVRDPGKPERELALASFLATQKGRLEEALEHLSHACKTCPLEQVAYASLALYDAPSVTESQRKQVEAWVSEASQRRPDLTVLANKLAALWIRQGRFDEAEAVYRRILSGDSDDSEALNNLAWLLAVRDQGKAEEAVELINRAIDQQGPEVSLVDTKAVALIRGGRSRDAIEVLKEAAATDSRNPSVPLHLAWALKNEGKPDEARKAFQKALELGWKPERSDPLERSFMEKLRQELGL